ncbi:MAG: CinA family protein [Candidatus Margulisiibacteriota bacterium]
MEEQEKTAEVQIEGFMSKMFSAIGKTTDEELANLMKREKLSLSVAESLTGGLICERISSFPGASEYFSGGIVCYTNRIKVTELAVPASIIAKEGPVNRQVAEILAENIRKKFRTTIGLSATGVAGPSTVTPPKPIGLTFIAISEEKGSQCKEFNFQGSRKEIREKAAQAALGLLWMHLTGQET